MILPFVGLGMGSWKTPLWQKETSSVFPKLALNLRTNSAKYALEEALEAALKEAPVPPRV